MFRKHVVCDLCHNDGLSSEMVRCTKCSKFVHSFCAGLRKGRKRHTCEECLDQTVAKPAAKRRRGEKPMNDDKTPFLSKVINLFFLYFLKLLCRLVLLKS